MLLFFSPVELGYRTMVSHHTGPDFTRLAFAVIELGVVFHEFRRLGGLRRVFLLEVPHRISDRRDVLRRDSREPDRSRMSG